MPAVEIAAPSQWRAADSLVAEHRADDRDEHRRRRQHQRAVGDAGARQAADEEELVEDVTDHAEAGQAEASRERSAARSSEESAARWPAASPARDSGHSLAAPITSEKRQRSDRHAHGVERLRVELANGALDDREVRAPDDGHQEQQGVERGEAGGISEVQGVQRFKGSRFMVQRFKGRGSRFEAEPLEPLNP